MVSQELLHQLRVFTSDISTFLKESGLLPFADPRRVKLLPVFSGPFMSSLDEPGLVITLLDATGEMVEYIDALVKAVGWPVGPSSLWRDLVSNCPGIRRHST